MKKEILHKIVKFIAVYLLYIGVSGFASFIDIKTGNEGNLSLTVTIFALWLVVMFVLFAKLKWSSLKSIKNVFFQFIARLLMSALLTAFIGFLTWVIVMNIYFALGGTE